jgi:hypothetical protein
MYDSLTTKELTALRQVPFEEAYWAVNVHDGDPAWFERCHPMHQELGHLFIEAGQELLAPRSGRQGGLIRQCPGIKEQYRQ